MPPQLLVDNVGGPFINPTTAHSLSLPTPNSKPSIFDIDNANEGESTGVKDLKASQAKPEVSQLDMAGKQTDLLSCLVAEVKDYDESLNTTVQMASKSQRWGSSTVLFKQEREDDKLDLRAKQAVLHLAWTDERMKAMERELRTLRIHVEGLPPDFDLRKKLKLPVYKHAIKQCSISEFQLNDESKNIPDAERPVLEVLVTENMMSKRSGTATNPGIDSVEASSLRSVGTTGISPTPERLRVRSRPLLYLLNRICGQDLLSVGNTRSVDTPAPVVFLRPFKLFVTYEKEIREAVGELQSKIERESNTAEQVSRVSGAKRDIPDFDNNDLLDDLKLLVKFLDHDLKAIFELREKVKDGTLTHIEYEDLWHLFEPNDIVVDSADEMQVYKVLSFTGGREILIDKITPGEKPVPLEGFMVDCYNLGFNGSFYGPKLDTYSIRRFQGSQAITSLPIYPLKFDPSAEKLKERFLKRGKEFMELTDLPFAHRMLFGKTLDEPVEEIDAQVIVDMTLAINKNTEWNPILKIKETELTKPDYRETQAPLFCNHFPKTNEGCCGGDVVHKDIQWDESRFNIFYRDHRHALGKRKANELSEDDRLLLPAWVYGFVLRSRRWITLRIDDLSAVKYESTFDELVLPDLHKHTVKALVQDHAKSSQDPSATSKVGAAMDLVRGKGKGLIILLHGEPGVGKTSTAECVADLTQRPLFPVTCGDIGETAAEVQSSLDYNFQLAHKWGCVLLLDEADVFLARRSKSDLRRNAVVSVFLRTLEYYSGILFLTTNRVGSIDPAFKSRIHMSLFYPHLSIKATTKLYKVFIKRTITEQENSPTVEFKVKPKEIMKFAKLHYKRLHKNNMATWNGRQIRNAFQTAIALAEFDARQPGAKQIVLGKAQFEKIAKSSEEFDKYLKRTLGMTESDLAKRELLRTDDYGRTATRQAGGSRVTVGPRKRSAKDPESESDSAPTSDNLESDSDDSEDNDSDSDSEDSDFDDDGMEVEEGESAKNAATKPLKRSKPGKTKTMSDAEREDAFQRFCMQEKKGKAKKK